MEQQAVEQIESQLTPAWLTQALREHGHLQRGMVARLHLSERFETPPSIHFLLEVAYTPDAAGAPAQRLRLKLSKPHKLERARRELRFYSLVAPLMSGIPVPRCYGSGSLADGRPYLLLEDLAATHSQPERGAWPAGAQVAAMVDSLAQLHATWWAHPRLVEIVGELAEQELLADFDAGERRYSLLLEQLGAELTASQRAIFQRYLAHGAAQLRRRLASDRPLTLCHPDNHHGNFLFPHAPAGRVYIIDWHGYECQRGATDIAGLLVRCLRPDQGDLADALLRRYYQGLCRLGVATYSWEECEHDYRLGVIDFISPLLSGGKYPMWFRRYVPTFVAEFERLGCMELLE